MVSINPPNDDGKLATRRKLSETGFDSRSTFKRMHSAIEYCSLKRWTGFQSKEWPTSKSGATTTFAVAPATINLPRTEYPGNIQPPHLPSAATGGNWPRGYQSPAIQKHSRRAWGRWLQFLLLCLLLLRKGHVLTPGRRQKLLDLQAEAELVHAAVPWTESSVCDDPWRTPSPNWCNL